MVGNAWQIIIRRILGLALVAVSLASLAITVGCACGVWGGRAEASARLDANLALAMHALASSERALTAIDQQLRTTGTSVASAEDTARSTAGTLNSTRNSLAAASVILRQDVPATVAAAQQALISAQGSARLIDDVLNALANIPLLNIRYQPDVPLYVALGNVANSLDGLPKLTKDLGAGLDITAADLPATAKGATNMAETLKDSQVSINEALKVVVEFQGQLRQARTMLEELRRDLPALINASAAVVLFGLFWLAVVQSQALLTGVRWLRGR